MTGRFIRVGSPLGVPAATGLIRLNYAMSLICGSTPIDHHDAPTDQRSVTYLRGLCEYQKIQCYDLQLAIAIKPFCSCHNFSTHRISKYVSVSLIARTTPTTFILFARSSSKMLVKTNENR